MAWVEILAFIIGLIALVIFIVFSLKMNKDIQKVNVRPNSPLLEVRALRIKPFTQGYMKGKVKSQIEKKNGTTLIEFYPEDVEQGEDIPRPDLQSFIVKSEFIKREAEGEDGSRRQTVMILPRSNLDLPRKLRSSIEGNELAKEGQLAFMEGIVGNRIIGGDEALLEMMKKDNRTGISKAVLKEMEKASKKIRDNPQQFPPPEHKTNP